MLPENFAWILQYFSSVMDIKPSELYTELLKVEAIVLQNHPDYFGTRIRSTNRSGSSHTNNDYKYRLSMSCWFLIKTKVRWKYSWNWLIMHIPATLWQILNNMKRIQWPETEIICILWNLLGKIRERISMGK